MAQIAPRLGDVRANLDRHLEVVAQAREQGADLVVFPELSLTGYVLRDLTPEVALAAGAAPLRRLAAASRDLDLVVGFVEDAPGHRFHNAAAYFSRGKIRHVHRKVYLPCYGMFQEARDFAPGERLRSFDAPFGPSGLLVCEDLWHPTSAYLLAHQGAEVILVLSAGPTRGTRPGRRITSIAVWRELLQVTAQFQTTFLVYVNRVGCEDGLTFGGGSTVVDPFGRVVAELAPLEEELRTVELDPEVLRRARTAYPLLRDEQVDLVQRELERLRCLRYDLPDAEPSEEPAPRTPRKRR